MSSISAGTTTMGEKANVAHLYRVSNKITGTYYIGKHNGVKQGSYWGSGTAWKDHLKKHGVENLTYEILAIGSSEYILHCVEKAYVTHEYIKSNPKCLNLVQGGYGIGRMPQDIVDKIAATLRGRPSWNKGIPCSAEKKEKISKSLTGRVGVTLGRKMPDETKKKISASKIGCKGHNKGKPVSQECRDRISQSLKGNVPWNKGVPATPEHAAASRIAMLGKKHSDETKRKMSLAQKGKIMSDKAKANMSQAQRNAPRVTCPQCSKVGGYRAMKRWHFDNCKGGA